MYALLETSRSCLSHIFMMICSWGWKWKILCCHGMHTKGIHERIFSMFRGFSLYAHSIIAQKNRLRWSIYTIFLQRKKLVIDVKICMHQKIQIVPSVWALLKSQSETHANIWDLLCCTLLHLLRIANVCDLQSKHNTTVNMTKSVHVWKGIGRSINFGGFFPQFLISTESVIIRIHLGLIQICKSQILRNKF